MERPHPDKLLTAIQNEERKSGRGQLKIFLGMAAGVGKTFAMLQRAHQLKASGVDVIVGWVDTHGRADTEALTQGLEIQPRLQRQHRGVTLEILDLDAILARRPKAVVIDELPHTNPHGLGLRHKKRYQDVLEILENGIDVFTALNVQHLESRVHVVAEITGVTVHETVPDSFLDEADEIILIDLPAQDLLQRLREGRIYPEEKARAAEKHFFKKGNLSALREMALRVAASRADKEALAYKTLHGIGAVWRTTPRLMVAVFGSPYSGSSIRWTRQLAELMKGTWIGVYVNSGKALTEEERGLLEENTELVRQLGGEFITIEHHDFVDGLIQVAQQQNVTQLIVGRSRRGFWHNLFSGGPTLQRLQNRAGNIDIYSLASERPEAASWPKRLPRNMPTTSYPWEEFGWILFAGMMAWLLASALHPYAGYESIGVIFIMTVTVSGLFLSRASVFALAALLSLAHNYFFIPPLHTLTIGNPRDALMFAMYFLTAASVGQLTSRLQTQKRRVQNREDRTLNLYHLSRRLAECQSLEEVNRVSTREVERLLRGQMATVLFQENGTPNVQSSSAYFPAGQELAVAVWVKEQRKPAGRFTETLPGSEATYYPIVSRGLGLGAVGIKLPADYAMDFERKNFAHAVVSQITQAIEREILHEGRKRLELVGEAEKLYRSLFDSVSHELKTPLTTIRIAAQEISGDLATQIGEQSERLLQVVNHLLDMSRIESGTLKPNLKPESLGDVLGPAIQAAQLRDTEFTLKVEDNLPALMIDAPLTVQALTNVLKNAKKYAGTTKPLEIVVSRRPSRRVEISVLDSGPGLPPDRPEIIFNKFYRVSPALAGGIGLGLPIAQGFLQAQGGNLRAENRKEGGARVTLELVAEDT